MKHTLEFLNPKWHYGENVTVRLGHKWVEKAHEGDIVEIVRTGSSEVIATGVITAIRSVLRFSQVNILDLWAEHDPECRTPDGLVKAMLRAYPDFTLDSPVTIIQFHLA